MMFYNCWLFIIVYPVVFLYSLLHLIVKLHEYMNDAILISLCCSEADTEWLQIGCEQGLL